jgi:hypothetical protein
MLSFRTFPSKSKIQRIKNIDMSIIKVMNSSLVLRMFCWLTSGNIY